jgi:hypothetical protein
MTKNFPADFYVTCATVIPVLFLAVAVQGRTYESVLRASVRADALTGRRDAQLARIGPSLPKRARRSLQRRAGLADVTSLFLLNIAVVIVAAGSIGEGLALWTLYQGSEVSGMRPWVFGLTMFLVLATVAGPVRFVLQLNELVDDPRTLSRRAVPGEAEASKDWPAEPGEGNADQAPEQ